MKAFLWYVRTGIVFKKCTYGLTDNIISKKESEN